MKQCNLISRCIYVAMATVVTGCFTVREKIEQQERLVTQGQYGAAYAAAASMATDAGIDGADSNFWNADAGTLALMAGQPKDAVGHLDVADNGFNDVARRYYGTSALDTVAEVLVNDGVTAYAPEGVDRVFVNLYKALAYGAQGHREGARVELNRARERQNEWFYTCAKDIQEQEEALSTLSQEERTVALSALGNAEQKDLVALDASVMAAVSQEERSTVDFFTRLTGFGNAYVAHMAGITRWCAGDNSRNDLAMAAALAPNNAYVTQDYAWEKAGKSPEDRVWIYVEDGLAPRRVSERVMLPYARGGSAVSIGTITFDMPRLQARAAASSGYTVNGTTALQPLLDVDSLMNDQFDRLWSGILVRQIARTTTRVLAQEATQHLVRSQTDNELAVLLVSLLFLSYDAATNVADLRCADLLPKTVWMASFERPKDNVVTLRTNEGLQYQIALATKGNTLLWVRKPAMGAAPTFIVVDLGQH